MDHKRKQKEFVKKCYLKWTKWKFPYIFRRSLNFEGSYDEPRGGIQLFFLIRRNPIRYLLVNLAVAHFMYAAFIAPSSHPDGFIGSGLYQFLTDCNVALMGAISSIITLVIISIERYYATLSSFDNKGKFSERKLKV